MNEQSQNYNVDNLLTLLFVLEINNFFLITSTYQKITICIDCISMYQ
jgi:hypothetical protein